MSIHCLFTSQYQVKEATGHLHVHVLDTGARGRVIDLGY